MRAPRCDAERCTRPIGVFTALASRDMGELRKHRTPWLDTQLVLQNACDAAHDGLMEV